jgi:hypothetical protein
MRLLLQDQVVQIELPSTNEQYYRDLVEIIDEVHRFFCGEYEITTYNYDRNHQIHVTKPTGDYIIKIKNQGQPEGDEYEGIEEVTFDLYFLKNDFKFLTW